MPDAKYGRLFTEDDVRALLEFGVAMPDVMVRGDRARRAIEAMDNANGATFPADEPLFLLRATDGAAPDAICRPSGVPPEDAIDYQSSLYRNGEGERTVKEAELAAAKMRAWQAANPDRMTTLA